MNKKNLDIQINKKILKLFQFHKKVLNNYF